MKVRVIVLNILLVIAVHSSAPEIPPGQRVFLSLPENERKDFLTFSLGDGYQKNETHIQRLPDIRFPDALGISEELVDKFQKLPVPENFTTNLYVWVKSQFKLSQSDLRQLIVYRQVCLDNGSCIELDDIGGLCCPF
ncbi:uncharacterized protein LOC107039450 [Diachasma alloeum]|uniref:uncharacterized protein LOC107039450 n=1 Tax=Diachasma alloeum TaxID=454923 RepID=UPI00073811C8|nr:uncharacterized protein LOC107039450 [Diachasma alloeum]